MTPISAMFTASGYGICGRKKVYYSKKEALKAAKKYGKKTKLFFYECPLCGWYHLSKSDHMIKTYAIRSAGIYFRR